ncbi:outer membrane lipoprotein carrier protein LolA [uncultured Enterovirga sp.]|uniref:LolA family protein n=1 Tax=uncultured Enterovirga sp. TaxID=2026352 RepID=UPI0035C9E29D
MMRIVGATALVAACSLMSVTARAQSAGDPLEIAPARTERAALNEREIVDRANVALNGVQSMSATFTQTGGEGRQLTGTVYVQRPGKLRFEYNKPSTMEIVSDGSTVLVRDRKLNTSDPYPVSQTPLKFLLSSRIDLARESRIRSVGREGNGVQVTIEDSSTLGGTSRITLSFDADLTTLRRWRVVDPQGYTTTVALSGIEKNKPLDPKIFMLQYMRPVVD